ncbi:hypothetical protein CHLRE_03g200700v5 [Chlamydomonas reinhardtii]|uniref:Uncharacterized protein n=1 Tax=Chlamydomonas reinhardtii TaxID=3055 RepID=A0A2K3DZF0_CHLRE|nr:uncharacterized protein CHLRE_03g200700v5 [Chlamydomonas reinhardtii]6U42_6G Chain 6G, FAP166 [Chlamydomonas reinhardtii]6U42_6H Chain 6H, FAP166 [Chlamydomonas reinhardtii]8GLV_6G Chain 6G, FAP166 [Chlamydomonas reinhardtii]8GLV_6H Chain 6H, FAP166 [Chlamydomonas reinhardtii]8GLV_HP Chain HP, FAP166 [Chlamydomonas reinhardtii]8GLV_HQ Chain HQ, FAP166 [Chlamydomonas reinhardtii]8GLV_Op Chain Op, FAP166 [Chlamydomonas reinhardtii]PNW85901.1 hypothetical protein CHLRE_03g200700v5 [Chlamydo
MSLTLNGLDESMRRMQGYEVTRAPEDVGNSIPNFKEGIFTYKGSRQAPWKSEQTHSFSLPNAYTARVLNGTIVHTGGATEMAITTHHTVERPMMPPGTIRGSTWVKPQYIPTDDPALDELHAVAYVVSPQLPALMDACNSYHLHSADGWITTAGFMTAARRAGLTLSRAEYLALERALTKDTMGRINYLQLEALVQAVTAADQTGEGGAEPAAE